MPSTDRAARDPMPGPRPAELAAVGLAGVILALAVAALTAVGLAAAIAGDGWIWPHNIADAARVIEGLGSGHPGAGLAPAQAARLPSAATVYIGVALSELALLASGGAVAVVVARRFTTAGDPRRGLASPHQARAALGARSVRRHAHIIRPDLHRPARGHSRTRAQTATPGEER
ncbi:MAG: conjugal transfer protein [Jatrophihabitans sp.]|uniref:conjugal transfer protein n=1 Tax=Jatrophihabitans sp. TaxID=1932789 RepID=UPI003F7D520D